MANRSGFCYQSYVKNNLAVLEEIELNINILNLR